MKRKQNRQREPGHRRGRWPFQRRHPGARPPWRWRGLWGQRASTRRASRGRLARHCNNSSLHFPRRALGSARKLAAHVDSLVLSHARLHGVAGRAHDGAVRLGSSAAGPWCPWPLGVSAGMDCSQDARRCYWRERVLGAAAAMPKSAPQSSSGCFQQRRRVSCQQAFVAARPLPATRSVWHAAVCWTRAPPGVTSCCALPASNKLRSRGRSTRPLSPIICCPGHYARRL